MAVQAPKTTAKGNATGFRSTKTPAPDEVTNIRAPGGQSYGENGTANPSSTRPGQRVVSQLGANLESSVDDPAFQEILSKGTARNVDVADDTGRTIASNGDNLLRDISAGGMRGPKSQPSPVHPAMARRTVDDGSPGGSVPSGVDTGATADPVRKPS